MCTAQIIVDVHIKILLTTILSQHVFAEKNQFLLPQQRLTMPVLIVTAPRGEVGLVLLINSTFCNNSKRIFFSPALGTRREIDASTLARSISSPELGLRRSVEN